MDNITHTLTGVLLVQAGLRKLTPRATWIAVTAANIPDLDILVGPWNIEYLNYHRHFSHSFLAVPLMASLALLVVEVTSRLMRCQCKKLSWSGAWTVAVMASLTHPLLDLTNSYGVRVHLPFSPNWYGWDIFFIIEPYVWLVLLGALIFPNLSRLLDYELGMKSFRSGETAARAGLVILILFGVFKTVLHDRAIKTLDSRLYEGSPARRVAAFPTPFDPWIWNGYVETEKYHLLVDVNLRKEFDVSTADKYYKPEMTPAIEAVRAHPLARDYLSFARYDLTTILPTAVGHRIDIEDLRFRQSGRVLFRCTFETDEMNRITSAVFTR